jgi:hypothetical protein
MSMNQDIIAFLRYVGAIEKYKIKKDKDGNTKYIYFMSRNNHD